MTITSHGPPKEFGKNYLYSLTKLTLYQIACDMCFELRCTCIQLKCKHELVTWISDQCFKSFYSNSWELTEIFRGIILKASKNFNCYSGFQTERTRHSTGSNPYAEPRIAHRSINITRSIHMKANEATQHDSMAMDISIKPSHKDHLSAQLTQFKKSIFYEIVEPFLPYKISEASTQCIALIELSLKEKDIHFLKSEHQGGLFPGIKLFCAPFKKIEATKADSKGPVLIEFPENSQLLINGKPTGANLRGKKKCPGTTRAPDVHPYIVVAKGVTNRVELYYDAEETYFLVAQKVLSTPIKLLLDQIIATKTIPAMEMREKLFSYRDEDDLLAVTELSLKCPLGFSRIEYPFRSLHCTHAQCFDGKTYLQLNEQMESWYCPICQVQIDPASDLVHDGFFLDILNNVLKEVESVLLEADGTWIPKDSSHINFSSKLASSQNACIIDLRDSPCPEQGSLSSEIIDLTLSDDDSLFIIN